MELIIRFVWFYNVIEKGSFVQGSLLSYNLEVKARKTLLHCKDYIVAVAKSVDSNKLLEILFCIISIN